MDLSLPPLVSQLCDLLQNPSFPGQLASAIRTASRSQAQEPLYLRVDASLVNEQHRTLPNGVFNLGCIDLRDGGLAPLSLPTPAPSPDAQDDGGGISIEPISALPSDFADTRPFKRHKTVSGLRLPHTSRSKTGRTNSSYHDLEGNKTHDKASKSIRQVESDTRFPQRAKPGLGLEPPVLEPTSTDKLIAGIWKQVYSPVELSRDFSNIQPAFNIRSAPSSEVFKSVNALCLKYYNRSQSSRALEMIVQAFWVECFEARTAVLRYEKPILSKTEARMIAIREACVVLNWKEKDLRNRMAIWRGYKEIKDYGGWASLVFASAGVYRFCKYRSEFGEVLFSRLRHIRSGLEVAADTLHPGWRDMLRVIQQDTSAVYYGNPHEWVITAEDAALPLASTYGNLNLPDGFKYQFVDECVLDETVFAAKDPRRVSELDPDVCPVCHEKQSDAVTENQCSCYPTLFGGVHGPIPVQIFRTANGKNNGVVACCPFARGTAIAEFTGLITTGIEGRDVMIGGSRGRTYQIYQGNMGNFTRFINHSCRPNSQFQRFYWRGVERILVVSRGVDAGCEITVDYSDRYWRELDKKCLCGEACCRFAGGGNVRKAKG
ncbi:SET domain-containing protein [Aspergillus undulatus]|uniref:SET domain-containing protein n=1 Tax=Aspergillus undulatus TaxID=1810928 RepID=UPI003CCDCE48